MNIVQLCPKLQVENSLPSVPPAFRNSRGQPQVLNSFNKTELIFLTTF